MALIQAKKQRVIPAQAGIQDAAIVLAQLDSGLRQNDKSSIFM